MKTTIEKLNKTKTSLSNHVARGNQVENQRSYDLIDRYTDLKEQASQEGVWTQYCDDVGFDKSHDAYDFFA